ncbi:redoxin domain-containing protein [Haloplanus halobius]|uniref:redoxin domain-containing protein n=1 Tax=Haloplanus halobius TaxID=2934938 RepID=UPI00200F6AFF|nr:redoxin domain-containing protein [Haloplanus sp. XH21]
MSSDSTSPHRDGEHRATPKEVGEPAPAFELPGAGEDGIDTFDLADYTEEGALILSFYPFDFSPICTQQLCGFRDAEWLAFTDNIDVVGISVDSAYSHHQFRDEYGLTFPLLTDRLASVAGQFGVRYDEWERHPAVCQRAIFAIDTSQTIRYTWWTEDGSEQPTLDDLYESIEWVA